MPQYSQLTIQERRRIAIWLKEDPDVTYTQIGKWLGRPGQTIGAEVARNGGRKKYDAAKAHNRAKRKRQKAGASRRRISDVFTKIVVAALLHAKLSPALISRWFKQHGQALSHEAIYQFIYWDKKQGGSLWQLLRHPRRRRKPHSRMGKDNRGKLPNAKHISDRPQASETRSELGHAEADTVYGPGTACLLTLVERKSRMLFACVMPDRTADTVRHALAGLCRRARRRGIGLKSLTLDNGKEFAMHELFVADFKEGVYFGDTHSPWQRGQIEERNRALRWYFPKRTDFSKVSQREVDQACDQINNRPMACLDYSTPMQVVRVA